MNIITSLKNIVTTVTAQCKAFLQGAFAKGVFSAVVGIAVVILVIGLVLAFIAGITAFVIGIPATVVWLAYNHVIAVSFGWPHISFWTIFALTWVACIVGNFFKGSSSSR